MLFYIFLLALSMAGALVLLDLWARNRSKDRAEQARAELQQWELSTGRKRKE
jgi:hypothetical protein